MDSHYTYINIHFSANVLANHRCLLGCFMVEIDSLRLFIYIFYNT